MRNVALWPATSGSSLAVIVPSWFGVHAAAAPSGLASIEAGASVGATPHVPSSLQKREAQSLSFAHGAAPWPWQAAETAKIAMLQRSDDREAGRHMRGTLRPRH